jgi:hypothetical protein
VYAIYKRTEAGVTTASFRSIKAVLYQPEEILGSRVPGLTRDYRLEGPLVVGDAEWYESVIRRGIWLYLMTESSYAEMSGHVQRDKRRFDLGSEP